MSNFKARIHRLEKQHGPADDAPAYVCYPDFETYQADLEAGKVTAKKIYIGVCPDDWKPAEPAKSGRLRQ